MNIFKKRVHVFLLVLGAAFSALQSMERQEDARSNDSSEEASEESTNNPTVHADYSDYLQMCDLIEMLDGIRRQVATESNDRALTPNSIEVVYHLGEDRLVRVYLGDIVRLLALAETSPRLAVKDYLRLVMPVMAPPIISDTGLHDPLRHRRMGTSPSEVSAGKKLRDEIRRSAGISQAPMPRVRGLASRRASEIHGLHRRGGHGGGHHRSIRGSRRTTQALSNPQVVHRAHSQLLDSSEVLRTTESQSHKDLVRLVLGRLDYTWEDESAARERLVSSLEPIEDDESTLCRVALSIAEHFIRTQQAAPSARDAAQEGNRHYSAFQGGWACDGISDWSNYF